MLDCNVSFHSSFNIMTFLLKAGFPNMKDGDFEIRKERHQNNSQQQNFNHLEYLDKIQDASCLCGLHF